VVEQYKRKPNTECIICKTPIYRRPVEILRNQGRVFCSNNCYGIASRRENPCLVCNKPILAKFNKKTCSRICSNKHRTGIKYKIGRPLDKAYTSRTLKLKLMKIRGEKCERCNYNKKEILQIHHKNRNTKDNREENLEIICPNCHYEEHFLEKSWLRKY
jgi:hypothetical protein